MASNGNDVRQAAIRELARRELARRQQAVQAPAPIQQTGATGTWAAQNPAEYDPNSPEFKAKYGQSLMDSVKAGLSAAPGAIKSTALGILQGGTVNLGDEMAAGAAMAEQRDLPLSQQTINSPEEYRARNRQVLDASRRQLGEAAKEHPWLYTEGNLVGGTALGSALGEGGLSLAGKAKTIPQAILYGGAEGAGYGAAYGAGAGTTPEERLKLAGKGAAMGGATGAVTGGISAYAASKGVKMPTTDDIKAKSQVAYKTAEDAGVALGPDAAEGLASRVSDKLQAANLHPKMHGKVSVALEDLKARAKDGFTLTQLDQQRQLFRDAGLFEGNSRLANIGARAIDAELTNLPADQLIGGDKPKALAALADARKAWSTKIKAQTLDDAMEIADVRGAGQTVAGKENAVRGQFQKLYESFIKDKAEAAMWSDEERQAIKNVAMGTKVGNALRILGKARVRNAVTAAPAVVGFHYGGPWGAAGVAGLGELGYWGSLASRLRQANLANQLIRTGSTALSIGPGASAANAGIAAALNRPGAEVLSTEELKKIAEKLRNSQAAESAGLR